MFCLHIATFWLLCVSWFSLQVLLRTARKNSYSDIILFSNSHLTWYHQGQVHVSREPVNWISDVLWTPLYVNPFKKIFLLLSGSLPATTVLLLSKVTWETVIPACLASLWNATRTLFLAVFECNAKGYTQWTLRSEGKVDFFWLTFFPFSFHPSFEVWLVLQVLCFQLTQN